MTLQLSEVRESLELFEFAGGRRITIDALRDILPDIPSLLFFAKSTGLDYRELSELLSKLFNSTVVRALSNGGHSTELQDYIVDTVPDAVLQQANPVFEPIPAGELLPELWEAAELEVAKSIAEVATKLASVIDSLPSKEGRMAFQHLAVLNRQRPTIGDYRAVIQHERVQRNLVILDVSGSMSSETVEAIINDVVALSWKANAYLAIVSNNTFVWQPGTYTSERVLAEAQYSGTHYESLFTLLDQGDWGTVVTIADYDSSLSAADVIRDARGRIGQVLDISLVNRPTFLAEVVGQLAQKVKPLMISATTWPGEF